MALNDLAFGVARQYALSYQHDDQEIRAFRDVAAACAWLEVTADDTAAVEALPPIIA